MRAIRYTRPGTSAVLEMCDIPRPEPTAGEVLVRLLYSGVNPSDWKTRTMFKPSPGGSTPNQDGAGIIEAVGDGVDSSRVGERVWIWEAAWDRSTGTAAEYTVVPSAQAAPLADAAFEVGAVLGIAFMTAHRCLTVAEHLPDHIAPGSLTGRCVLVQGGAGGVGNAAIQLARWAGATVIATVSSPAKGELATAAGAHHVLNYKTQDIVGEVRSLAPDGVDAIVEVALAANAARDVEVLGRYGAIASYASDGGDDLSVPVRGLNWPNARFQFVLIYTVPAEAKVRAVRDISAALSAGAIGVGVDAGLPLHRFPLNETAAAHLAVENNAVGKVIIDVTA